MKSYKKLYLAFSLLVSFVLWTILVRFIDVAPIGPQGSSVGLATVNQFVHTLTGVHFALYEITDWLGLIPVGFSLGFAILGLVQWIRRKQLTRVDSSLFVLGFFYILLLAAYLLFEEVALNYRPVLINGFLEASYPSSTTLLVMCVMPTTISQFNTRIHNIRIKWWLRFAIVCFIIFMVLGRIISGVHWITDIIGSALFSAAIVLLYAFVIDCIKK